MNIYSGYLYIFYLNNKITKFRLTNLKIGKMHKIRNMQKYVKHSKSTIRYNTY